MKKIMGLLAMCAMLGACDKVAKTVIQLLSTLLVFWVKNNFKGGQRLIIL